MKFCSSSVKTLCVFFGAEGCCVIEPLFDTWSEYTSSSPLSSEAAPVAQLQTPVIKPSVILFSGLLPKGLR